MPWPRQADCDAFYGNPRVANAQWQADNLVRVGVPWIMMMGQSRVPTITIHKRCAASLKAVLANAWDDIGRDQEAAHRRGWTVYSGSYNYRPIRGSRRLSMHAYGAAIDFDAPDNGLGSDPADSRGFVADDPLVKAFEAEGWIWGGRWKGRSDPMHFQAAIV